MKVVILVLSKEDNIYNNLEQTIRKTWGDYHSNNISIYYYYGDAQNFRVIDDKIYTKNKESLHNIGYKTIDSLEYIYDNLEFDYIYRTNSSSYVNINNMVNFLKEKPLNNFYCAKVNIEVNGIKFGSGSGYFISKDIVKFIIENKNKWNHNLMDDVSLGNLLLNNGFKLTPSIRLDIDSIIDNKPYYNNKQVDISNLNNNFHFRCKSKDSSRNMDVKIMNYIHNHFNQ